MVAYIAIIHKDTDSDYGVSFPDFLGCISAGTTLDETRSMAVEALAGHITMMQELGETLPAPSTLEQIMEHPDFQDGVAILVDAPPPSSRAVRINITMDQILLAEIDSVTRNRSAFLADAARQVLHPPTGNI